MALDRWKDRIDQLGGLIPRPQDEFAPLLEDELRAIEAKFGEPLPEDYRMFLKQYGSSTFSRLASIRSAGPLPNSLSDDGLLPFSGFYGSNSLVGKWPSVFSCADHFRGDIVDGLIPIAHGWEDDQICIGLAGEWRGKLFYWDSQGVGDEDEGGGAVAPDTYFIAESFSDFLNRIELSANED
jgi:hypothetical protein